MSNFSINFNWNWYYIVAPMLVLLVALFFSATVKMKNGKAVRLNSFYRGLVSIIAGVVVEVMVALESNRGIFQYFDNGCTYESESVIGFFMVLIMAFAIEAILCFVAADRSSLRKMRQMNS